ncbi:MAG: branched-chain amino acid ABC transporter ATP-binding protein [Comamonas sp. SCN 65-56]|uniref:ABC transporter ATP-binding protein n=1 Tax=Comamonas sp. SCN 65-56 TaxID=1660095 RepID=UPI000868B618|nr:ABC transporter ATP-binding protein [Comamonas sp. SCN 65-56]ODS90774.1 MAG: branched-chain amino acid ABC transporter ATP-binding protein [Comamonas sp. SCN 65-56]
MSAVVLEVRHLDKHYGGLHVTRDVSLQLARGDRLALIGPNGAGKTTLVNQISGTVAPSSGSVHLQSHDVTGLSQAERVRKGLVRTFQITTLAPHLAVRRQVELALFERSDLTGRFWRSIDDYPLLAQEAQGILDALGLGERAAWPTERLAYGEQRLVELALAMALKPKVLLLDEPMAGVPQGEGARLLAALDALPPELAVLIIEHDMDLVFRLARRIVVLAEGAVIASGTPADIQADPVVRSAYLGD